jgi:hypothetical protein
MSSIKLVDENGYIEYKNEYGRLHRIDGPAYEEPRGYKEWRIDGVLHREDGSAIIWSDRDEWYYLNNKRYSKEDYEQEVIKLKLKRIKDL